MIPEKIPVFITLCILGVTIFLHAQTPSLPCSAAEARQFDFWLGDWELTWPGGQAGTPAAETGKGTNRIEKLFGECVIQENFAGDGGFAGKSWSVYDAGRQLWRQTWVDNSGGYLVFTGGFRDGKMILQTAPREQNGKIIVSRMVFENISPDSLDWNWQRSPDGGESWSDVWNIHYRRR